MRRKELSRRLRLFRSVDAELACCLRFVGDKLEE